MLGVVLAVTWLVRPAIAQAQPAPEPQDRVEVFGGIGYGTFSNGDDNWGNGLDYGGGAGFRPFSGNLHRLGFEVRMIRLNTSEGLSASSSQSLDARLFVTNAVYLFGRNEARMRPYAFGGLGYMTADYSHQCVDCVFDPDPVTGELVSRGVVEDRVEDSEMGFTLGAGVKIFVQRRWSIRSEGLLASTTPGSGWNWGWARLQIGLGVHF
jgi:opacity protein-like surface antigen